MQYLCFYDVKAKILSDDTFSFDFLFHFSYRILPCFGERKMEVNP